MEGVDPKQDKMSAGTQGVEVDAVVHLQAQTEAKGVALITLQLPEPNLEG